MPNNDNILMNIFLKKMRPKPYVFEQNIVQFSSRCDSLCRLVVLKSRLSLLADYHESVSLSTLKSQNITEIIANSAVQSSTLFYFVHRHINNA